MSVSIKTATSLLAVTFVAWYFLKRTGLGQDYAADMWSIPQFFITFFGISTPIIRGSRVSTVFRG